MMFTVLASLALVLTAGVAEWQRYCRWERAATLEQLRARGRAYTVVAAVAMLLALAGAITAMLAAQFSRFTIQP